MALLLLLMMPVLSLELWHTRLLIVSLWRRRSPVAILGLIVSLLVVSLLVVSWRRRRRWLLVVGQNIKILQKRNNHAFELWPSCIQTVALYYNFLGCPR